ncbi:MAG TPA: peptidylprolyl isomerase [Anaerolineales bacterium]|nr:peptidylprolyl isomerase [Anaerolineales bacterium]
MAKNKPTKIVTKKHLAREERERQQTRIITGVSIGIVALIVLAFAYGLLNDSLFNYWRPAVTVNGQSLSMHEFQVRVRAQRQSIIGQYMQYQQFAQMFGMDPNSDPQLAQALNQFTNELDTPSILGGQIIDSMINDLVIRQYAKANGITVTANDVETEIRNSLAYYPSGTPTVTLTPTELVYPTLDATQLAVISPTYTPTLAATSTPRPTWTPNLTATATPQPSITPTETPYTLAGYQSKYQDTLKQYSPDGMNETLFRKIYYESGIYQQRVQDKVTADVPHAQEEVWARQILVADEATAKSILSELQAGGDFATLASKYSLDTATKDKGGDLGWVAKGVMVSDVEPTAFALKVGQTSQPIKSTLGYFIVQVLGHEVRPLTDTEYQTAVSTAFNTWLTDQRKAAKIVINASWTNYIPTSPTLEEALAADSATQTAYVATYQAQYGTK